VNDELESDLLPTAHLLRAALRAGAEVVIADVARNDHWFARLVDTDRPHDPGMSAVVDLDLRRDIAVTLRSPRWRHVVAIAVAVAVIALVAVFAVNRNRSNDVLNGEGDRFFVLLSRYGDTRILSSAEHTNADQPALNIKGFARIYARRGNGGALQQTLTVTTVQLANSPKRGFPIDEPTIVVAGNVGHIRTDGAALSSVQFEDDFVCGAVALSGVNVERAALEQVAPTIECVTDARGTFAAVEPPAGFTLEAERGPLPQLNERWSLDYESNSSQFILDFERSDDAVDLVAFTGGTGDMTATRRGQRDYWITTADQSNGGAPEVDVYWRDGSYVLHLSSFGTTPEELLAVADDVHEVTKADFERQVGFATDRQGAASEATTIGGPGPTQRPTQPGIVASSVPAGWHAIHILPSTKPFALGVRQAATGRVLTIDWATGPRPGGTGGDEVTVGGRTVRIERSPTGTAVVAIVQIGELTVTLSGSEATDDEIAQIVAGLQPATAEDYVRYNTALPIAPAPTR
jgi:hypothetical protein